jgi:hypothetical protein
VQKIEGATGLREYWIIVEYGTTCYAILDKKTAKVTHFREQQ